MLSHRFFLTPKSIYFVISRVMMLILGLFRVSKKMMN